MRNPLQTQDLRSKEEGLKQFEAAYLAQIEIKKEEIEQAKSEIDFAKPCQNQP